MKKIVIVLMFLIGCFSQLKAQLTVTPATNLTDVQNYVQNILAGPGVTISNVQFTGLFNQIGQFNGASSNIGFSGGVVLNTGNVTEIQGIGADDVAGSGASGLSSADLLSVAQSVTSNPQSGNINSTEDLAMLEFDFVPISNVVNFNFVFASDEYLTYVNTAFNDVFGFFVAGPGITGPYSAPVGFPGGSSNLATVPGSNPPLPITISTIHPGLNSQFYFDNELGTTHAFNGQTVSIPITFNVICGETYHFKFAVADCQDDYLATAVFLEEGSFSSPPIDLELQTSSGTDVIAEACLDANVLFIRSECQSFDSLVVNFAVSGTATQGVDYTMAASPIILVPNQDTALINIQPIIDALTEGNESIVISVSYLDAFGNIQTLNGTIYIQDVAPFQIIPNDTIVRCYNDEIPINFSATGGSYSYTFDWLNSTSTSNSDTVSINSNGIYYYPFTVTDICLGTFTDSVMVTMNQTLAIDTMGTQNTSACASTGVVWGLVEGNTGQPQFNWTGPTPGSAFTIDASVMQNLPAGWYVFTITDNVCTVVDSIEVMADPGPIADFSQSVVAGCDPLNVEFTNNSQNANNFLWSFGNGNNINVNNLSSQNQTYSNDATIMLVAYAGVCSDTTYGSVTISICGCTDPTAINYNPLANLDNGSCVYPVPTVIAPNVFTPNGDGSNQIFELTTTNAVKIDLVISNRWGNKVIDKSGLGSSISWDGNINGVPASEGVYFYQYTVYGLQNQEIKGHGFVQLIR